MSEKEEYTNRNAICPHCGFEHRDSWDFGNGLIEEDWADIECDELRRVLDGKAMKVLAFRSKGEYEAHSAIYASSGDKTSGTIVVYMEDSIADKI